MFERHFMSSEFWNISEKALSMSYSECFGSFVGCVHDILVMYHMNIGAIMTEWYTFYCEMSILKSAFGDTVRWYIKVFEYFSFFFHRCDAGESLHQVADVMLNPYWIPFLHVKYWETRYLLPLYLTKCWKRRKHLENT